ncbi:MAG: glucose-6-phosphate dehydrogenase [Bryobacterales bacterium]|nr:glucose-6-phosphate dehydrogenase [Bryobacterales bacterium]
MAANNPFADPARYESGTPDCAVVIFGASGDLTRRKLMPALYRLMYEGRLSPNFAVIGVSRSPLSDDAFRSRMEEGVRRHLEDAPFDEDIWRSFAEGVFYMAGDIHDRDSYQRLRSLLARIGDTRQTAGNVLFYLSTQPGQYAPVADGLGEAGLARTNGWRRLVVEKPFGHDLASARELSARLQRHFPEQEVYRIDHYLGKETVQNILAFRFGNGIFEPLWNRRYIDHVQITAAESIGVEGRGGYYEDAGALRDMIQNHLLQVMATVTMEPSATFEPDAVRDERAKLLRSIRVFEPGEVAEHAVAGQYGPARIGGADVPGYREEPDVRPDSQTDTYAAVTFFVDNWRWAGVPFYVRTGKQLPRRVTEIAIQFRDAPHRVFGQAGHLPPDLLILRIQPEEGISLKFVSKKPGTGMQLRPVSMDFNYGSSFGERSPSAYETLLLDAIRGDATLYTRQDMVEASWRVVEPIVKHWAGETFDFPNYAAGTWGPAAADRMLARRGHAWRRM